MNSTHTNSEKLNLFGQIVSYLPLVVIFLAVTGNTASFFIFRFSKEFKNISSMVFMSFVAVFGTTSLFVWNLNHFLKPNFEIQIEYLNDFSCKFFIFLQYLSLQAIGLLLSVMCIDRFVTIMSTPGSIYSRLPFSTVKSSYIWSFSIIIVLILLNFHILIFNGNYKHIRSTKNITSTEFVNGTFISRVDTFIEYQVCYWYNQNFRLYPTWDQVNLGLYNFFPFTVMFIFNILLITKTLMLNSSLKSTTNKEQIKSIIKKRRLTISILAITFAYIILTLPVTIMTGFYFYYFFRIPNGMTFLSMADSLGFLFHSTIFINCMATNIKFRKYVMSRLTRAKGKQKGDSTKKTKTTHY